MSPSENPTLPWVRNALFTNYDPHASELFLRHAQVNNESNSFDAPCYNSTRLWTRGPKAEAVHQETCTQILEFLMD